MYITDTIIKEGYLYFISTFFIPLLAISIYFFTDNLIHKRSTRLVKRKRIIIYLNLIIFLFLFATDYFKLPIHLTGISIQITGLSIILLFFSPFNAVLLYFTVNIIAVLSGRINYFYAGYNLSVITLTAFILSYIFSLLNKKNIGIIKSLIFIVILQYMIINFIHSFFISSSGILFAGENIPLSFLTTFREAFMTVFFFQISLIFIEILTVIFTYLFLKYRIPELLFIFRISK